MSVRTNARPLCTITLPRGKGMCGAYAISTRDEDYVCTVHAELHDVMGRCARWIKPGAPQVAAKRQDGKKDLYILYSQEANRIKVGVSNNVAERLRSISRSAPFRLHLLAVARGAGDHERELHKILDRWRTRPGEWFDADDDAVRIAWDFARKHDAPEQEADA